MSLIKTINEVKVLLPNFISNLSDPNSLPNFDPIEMKYLVPITGFTFYSDILDKYNTNPGGMTADEQSFLKKMQLVVAAYGFHDGLTLGHITMTDTGARKMNAMDTTQVARWEYLKLEQTLLNTAFDAVEVLLTFLYEKKPASWLASNEYKKFSSLLIKSGTDFDDQYSLYQPMRTFFSIRSAIADAQELCIKDAIGEDLLNYIVNKETPDASLIKAIAKLKKAAALFSIKKCCTRYVVRFTMEGFTVLSGDIDSPDHAGRKSADPVDLDAQMRSLESDAQDFLNKAKSDLAKYYGATTGPVPDNDFKAAYAAGPLTDYTQPGDIDLGNDGYVGIFRM